ncbi:hypothetical protein RYX36_017503 [Vicia faba]
MEIANASVSPAIHIARALGVLSIEASLATSLACSLRWSTSCLTSAEELAGSPICVASTSCCNSGMLGGLCARQSHHIAHPRYSAGKIKLKTSVTCCPCPDPACECSVAPGWRQLVEVEWLLLLTIQSSHSWKTMHGMLCVHVLIFVMLAFFYCLAAFPNLPDSNRAIHSHRGNNPLPSVPGFGCLAEIEPALSCHCEAIVKVHGVLPSSRWYSASSRRIQFHRVHVGDSGAVVTPFVQHRAGVRLYTSCYHLAESCVFNKQSLPPVHREDRPPNSKFFPGSFNLVDYDNSRDYKQTRNYGRALVFREIYFSRAYDVDGPRLTLSHQSLSDSAWPGRPTRLALQKGELRGANPSTRGLGWANLWCTGCYANSSAGLLSWYGRTAAKREILLYISSRTMFLNRTSIGERCKHRERSSPLKAQPKQSQRVSSALLMSEGEDKKDRSTKCLGHPREAYGALREKKLLGRGSRPESYRYTWGNRALTGGVGARAARHGSSQLNLTGAISWRPPSIPELQQLAEATQIGEPASSSAEVRQLVDHLSEQAREVASEASMERTPRALAMWMAGLTLAFAISIALAQKGKEKAYNQRKGEL